MVDGRSLERAADIAGFSVLCLSVRRPECMAASARPVLQHGDLRTFLRVPGLCMQANKDMDRVEDHFLEIQRMETLSVLSKCYNSRKEMIPSMRYQAIYQLGRESMYD
jgi:hypothetical protein